MTDSKPPQDRPFRRLNLFGWCLFISGCVGILGIILRLWPFQVLDSQEPSVWRYGFQVALLMLDIPLAWAAWKAVKAERHYKLDRANIAIWVLVCSMFVIGGRFDLQQGETWRPQTPVMLAFTLALAVHAFGRRKSAARGTVIPVASNPPELEPGSRKLEA